MKFLFNKKIAVLIAAIILVGSLNVAHAMDLGVKAALIAGLNNMLSQIAYYTLKAMALLTAAAGLALDTSIKYSTLEMHTYLPTKAINGAWTVMRDVGNLAFIFILIYIAIRTILGMEGTDTRRLIRNVIIIGLLVNFSLFITQFLIDVSNVVSLSFYKLFITNTSSLTSFSQNFVQPLGIQTFYDAKESVLTDDLSASWKAIVATVGGSIFLLVLAITFLQAAVMFLIRFVVLIFAMVMSALAFFAYILPNTKPWFDKWLGLLMGQLFFAPIYMILIWVVLVIIRTSDFVGGTIRDSSVQGLTLSDALNTFSGGVNTAQASTGYGLTSASIVIFNYLLIIGLMIAASIISISVASRSGKAVTKMATTFSPFRLPGYAMRSTVGRYAYNESKRDDLKERAAQGGIRGFIAAQRLRTSKAVSKSSLDPLNNVVGKAAGFKDPGKGGYAGYMEQVAKEEKKFAAELDKGDMFENKDTGHIITGTELKKIADAQAKARFANDEEQAARESKNIYNALVKEKQDAGYKKYSRKEIYARNVLKKGSFLQKLYTVARPDNTLKILFGGKTVNEVYRKTFPARYKAGEDMLKDAKKESNKANLGKLKNDRDRLKKQLNDLETVKTKKEEIENKIKELGAAAVPDQAQIDALKVQLGPLKARLDDIKTGYDAIARELSDKENDIADAEKKDDKKDDNKDKDDKKDDTKKS